MELSPQELQSLVRKACHSQRVRRWSDDQFPTHTRTVFFDLKGLWGMIYWYVFYRIHTLVFSGLMREVARQAEASYKDDER